MSAPLLGSNGRNRTVVVKLYVGKLGNMIILFAISGITTLGRAAPEERQGSALETDCFTTFDASRKAADFFYLFLA